MSFFGIDLIDLIELVGYVGLFAIVFAETGLFLGFFLPGDSLLFIAGFLVGQGVFSLPLMLFVIWFAAITGNLVGYEFGRRVGPRLFSREDSLLFKKSHALKAQAFYERHGPKTIVLARFMPIVRTFAPIVAGVGRMEFRTFFIYNLIGGTAWTAILVLGGYFLGSIPFVREHLEPMILLVIFLSILPGDYQLFA
ncbi:MAG: VTT domain-containing protein [Candidatus Moraniibacteriota bacterium]